MVDATRLREELRRMRALIQEDPAVKAQFDKDGNGTATSGKKCASS